MSRPFYIRRNNQVKGPFPAGQIAQALLIGRFRLSDEVSIDREEWQLIESLPELVPDVLRGDPDDPETSQRLAAARRWADERRPVAGAEAEGEPRRQPESSSVVEYRQHRESIYRRLGRRKDVAVLQVLLVVASLAALVYAGFNFTPSHEVAESQCHAEAAPRVDWRNCRLAGLSAIKRDLSGAQMNSSILTDANFFAADLHDATLDYAELRSSNLSFANCSNASMKGADLQQADLSQANLRGADLRYANLTGARLDGAALDGATLEHAIWIDGRQCQAGSVGSCVVNKDQR